MIGLMVCAVLALVFVTLAVLFGKGQTLAVAPPPPEPEPVEVEEPVAEPPPPPPPADLDPQVELADLLARANKMAGGRYLAINVGPSRKERRAEKAIARRSKR